MDRGYEKERFAVLKVKVSVAKKFKRFCKGLSKSRSMGLLCMLEFFEANGVSPEERMDETIASLKWLMKRRFNAMIAIIRDIEKSQTKPTTAMLQALFEQHLQGEDQGLEDEATEFIELKFAEVGPEPSGNEETTVPRVRYERLEERMELLKADFAHVLDHVNLVKSPFGKESLQLGISMEEVEKYKRNIQNS